MTQRSEERHVIFDGHRIAYRMGGEGPAIVFLRQNHARLDSPPLRYLRQSYQVLQIDPLGHARSDRPPRYPAETLPDQVLSVLDHHDVDRFVVWGYSYGGALAAAVARATPRAVGLITAAFALLSPPSQAYMLRREREAPDNPGEMFYRLFWALDWAPELAAMCCPKLIYFGGEDRGEQGRGLRRTREQLDALGVDIVELAGFDHRTLGDEDAANEVMCTVVDWLSHRIGPSW
jgi:pimeloyl-ACP methyl ester carboxylesterase